MKRTAILFCMVFSLAGAGAQVTLKTIVPQQAIVSGESFQVQYILEDGDKLTVNTPASFNNFRIVPPPNIYIGSVPGADGLKPVKNTVVTLAAGRPGKFLIPGATVNVNGKLIRSNDAMVEVISKEEAIRRFDKENGLANSEYFIRPGENAYDKIRQNLFVKVMVDKRDCYVGEPILATFKLYSRLESRSDIVKNPGFYGFTVYDMVNLSDKQITVETINGKSFDVHTIRKVQLFPLQAGAFTIDEMEVKNQVEFSRSAVNKKTEQEIVEGVLGNNNETMPREGTEKVETDIHTEPVTIRVKPIPEKSRPASFNGAAGQFTIASMVADNEISRNEEGFLEIKISGQGNFIQLSAPVVQWPDGIEAFDPVVTDAFDKTRSPLAGSRTFRFPFVSSKPGEYVLPAVQFSFFNPDSGTYKTVTTQTLGIQVSNTEKPVTATEKRTAPAGKTTWPYMAIAVLAIGIAGFFIWSRSKGKKKEQPLPVTPAKPVLPVDELLAPVRQDRDDRSFYAGLQNAIWRFYAHHLGISGSAMEKRLLVNELRKKGIDQLSIDQLQNTLQLCEAGMFTSAAMGMDKEELLQQTKKLLEQSEKLLL